MNLTIVFFIILTLLVGCKKPAPDPHLGDYIYQSLKQELSASETKYSDIKKQYDDFVAKTKDPSLSVSDLKMARAKADFALREIRKVEQKIKYWKLKLLSREELVRSSYLAAFNRGEEWNNDDEIQKFKKAQSWGKKRQPAKANEPKKESASQPPSEGHESPPEEEAPPAAEHGE